MSNKVVYLCVTIFWSFCSIAIIFACFYSFSKVVASKSTRCTTPNREEAQCMPLRHCRILIELSTKKNKSAQEFLEASSCGDGIFMVCCGTSGNYSMKEAQEELLITAERNQQETEMETRSQTMENPTKNLTVKEKRKYVREAILLNETYCGQQHWDDFNHSENETNGYEANVYEFPWLVSLVSDIYRCNGFLISKRYFITTKECFFRGYETALNPNVLVGVHDIRRTISCIRLPYTNECSTHVQQLHIQEGFKINSFVVVKLAQVVYFSNFVRPICLPFEAYERPKVEDIVMISGWGKLLGKKEYVSIKKRNRQKVISVNNNKSKSEFVNSKNCISTLPLQNSTTACWGDEGSPTMYMYKGHWFAAGVTIAGSMCMVNHPVLSIPITPDVVNKILDVIYDYDCRSQQNSTES